MNMPINTFVSIKLASTVENRCGYHGWHFDTSCRKLIIKCLSKGVVGGVVLEFK